MYIRNLVLSAALAAGFATQAPAQQLGIGTMSQGTSGYSMGSAIAAVLSENGIDALVQPSAGTSAYLPLIQFGELDFDGLVTPWEVVPEGGKAAALHLLDVQLAGRPTAGWVEIPDGPLPAAAAHNANRGSDDAAPRDVDGDATPPPA